MGGLPFGKHFADSVFICSRFEEEAVSCGNVRGRFDKVVGTSGYP